MIENCNRVSIVEDYTRTTARGRDASPNQAKAVQVELDDDDDEMIIEINLRPVILIDVESELDVV